MGTRVVLIEDHRAMLAGLELLLQTFGLEVVATAHDASRGATMVEATEPDVVVLDDELGEESGIALTRELLGLRPRRRVIMYTASYDVRRLERALDVGVRGYVLKDATAEELVRAIEAVAGGGSFVDPRLRQALLRRSSARTRQLSRRERQILGLLADGLNGEEIAERLVLSPETIKTHIRNALSKLGARNRTHGVAIALQQGLLGRQG